SGRFVVTMTSPSGGGKPRFGNSNVWNRPSCANSRRYLPASPMLVVPDTQAAASSAVRRSFSNGNPNVARFASNARAIGAARAIARRWASAKRIGSYELKRRRGRLWSRERDLGTSKRIGVEPRLPPGGKGFGRACSSHLQKRVGAG